MKPPLTLVSDSYRRCRISRNKLIERFFTSNDLLPCLQYSDIDALHVLKSLIGLFFVAVIIGFKRQKKFSIVIWLEYHNTKR